MAKLGSVLNIGKKLSKARKRVQSSSLFGKGKSALEKVKGKIGTGISKIKGRSLLPNTKLLEPIRPDLKEGGVRKVNRLVESKVQSLIPKLSEKVSNKANLFDPNAFLGKIFDGGLNSLNSFASGLNGLKGSLQQNLEFIKEAKGILVDLIDKMAKSKPKKAGGGFFKGLITTVARIGLMAMALKAAPAVMGAAAVGGKLALGAGLLAGGAFLGKKLLGKKKEDDPSITQMLKEIDAERFNDVVQKYQKELNLIEKRARKNKRDKEDKKKDDKKDEKTDQVEETKKEQTESKVEPQDEPMGGKSPNALLKVEDGKMIVTPTSGGEETSSEVREKTTVDPVKEEDKPQGLKRVAAGFMDNLTMNMFDFDSRGSNVDGIKNFLKGDKGESGGTGGRGALGSQGDPGKKDVFKEQTAIPVPIGPMGIIAGGIITGGKFIANKIGEKKEEEVTSKGEKKGGSEVKGDDTSTAVPDPKTLENISEVTKDVSKSPKSVASLQSDGSIVPIPLPASGGADSKQQPIQRTENTVKNNVPLLPAIDMNNIHVHYSRSVFNIVDAM